MEQKTKLSALIVIVILVAAGGWYFAGTKDGTAQPVNSAQTEQINQMIPNGEVNGKIRAIDEKIVLIELGDGKGFATYISSSTPVATKGVAKLGTLADLKIGQNVTIKVDNANKAVQILIKK